MTSCAQQIGPMINVVTWSAYIPPPGLGHQPDDAPKTFYGLQIRGLMARAVRYVRITPVGNDGGVKMFDVRIHWTVPSVSSPTGAPIDLTFRSAMPAYFVPEGLTPEQSVLREALRELWQHEFEESLWMADGTPVGNPGHLHG